MNALRKFVYGFAVGVGLIYWYLHYGEPAQKNTNAWFSGAAGNYRGDKVHRAADDALGK